MVEFLFVTQARANPRLTLLDRDSPRSSLTCGLKERGKEGI